MNNRVTIEDIAQALNTTPSTISRALKGNTRISLATRELVKNKAKELGYHPHNIASALRSGQSRLIGVLLPRTNRNFFSSVVQGIEEVANQLNYHVIVSQTNEEGEKEKFAIRSLINTQVDGIIASIGKKTESLEHYQEAIDSGTPLILFDRTTPNLEVNQVAIDDEKGAFQATNHLIEQGCTQIAHFTSTQKLSIYQDRLKGYRMALEAHGLPYDENLVVQSDLQLEDGKESIRHLLNNKIPIDALFSASDYAALGALQALKKLNKKIPEEIAIVGFANEPFTEYTDPSLSSVDQKSNQMGRLAAEMFFEMIKNQSNYHKPRRVILDPELIIRNSSKKINH